MNYIIFIVFLQTEIFGDLVHFWVQTGYSSYINGNIP